MDFLRKNWMSVLLIIVVSGLIGAFVYTSSVAQREENTIKFNRELCQDFNAGREIANERAMAQKEFMLLEADARHASGDVEVAKEYRKLAEKMKPAPLADCHDL